jgi:CheY-like chemotaxis protein
MSRGPGRVHEAIIAMMEAEPQGAWTTTQLCERIYGTSVEKSHRAAVARVVCGMKLPPLWCVRRTSKPDAEYCLYNAGNVESTLRAVFVADAASGYAWDFEAWKERYPHCIEKARNDVDEALRYHDALPVGKLDIEVNELRQVIGLLRIASTSGAKDEISRLARRAREITEQREMFTNRQAPTAQPLRARFGRTPFRERRGNILSYMLAGKNVGPATTLDGKCILIAEDESLIAMDLAEEVAESGGKVVGPVGSVDDALDIVATTPLDGAILDLKLRDQTAFPVADALAARHIPFVFETAYMRAGEAPARHAHVPCIEKPFMRSFVRNALERVMYREEGWPLS